MADSGLLEWALSYVFCNVLHFIPCLISLRRTARESFYRNGIDWELRSFLVLQDWNLICQYRNMYSLYEYFSLTVKKFNFITQYIHSMFLNMFLEMHLRCAYSSTSPYKLLDYSPKFLRVRRDKIQVLWLQGMKYWPNLLYGSGVLRVLRSICC